MSGTAMEEKVMDQTSTLGAKPAQITDSGPLTNGAASKDHPAGEAASEGHADPVRIDQHAGQGLILSDGAAAVVASTPAQHLARAPSSKHTSFTMNTGNSITVRSAEAFLPSTRGRGRGGASRARGKGRASAKARKRKRDEAGDDDDEDEDDSEDSEVYAPTAVMTKSGRSIQRPTAFVPPPAPSPGTAATRTTPVVKKKRVWRRNPENAVCKLCLRGVSPASNMIVFCDGCNTPYHRWCHHPPIDQSVIDETDKEWYCRQCRRERIVPVPEADIAHFVAAGNASMAERQKFFAGLTPGALVTLLARITTIHPDLPVFDPEFASQYGKPSLSAAIPQKQPAPSTLGASTASANANSNTDRPATIYVNHDDEDEDDGYGPEEHPAHYVRPGRGLMSTLPPDKDDEQHLVDEDSSKGVFHHIYLVDEKAANSIVKGAA